MLEARKSRLKFMQIRTILYQYTKTLIKHVFLLNFTYELLMSFRISDKTHVDYHKTFASIFSAYTTSMLKIRKQTYKMGIKWIVF